MRVCIAFCLVLSIAAARATHASCFLPETISCGNIIASELTFSDCLGGPTSPYEKWQFYGVAGTYVEIYMASDDSFLYPRLEVYDPSNTLAGTSQANPGQHDALVFGPLSATGTWRIQTSGAPNLSQTGEYLLQLYCGTAPPPPSDCTRTGTTACLLSGRFEVTVAWNTDSDAGLAGVMAFGGQRAESDQSAFFWFFNPANFEMGVKLVDGCAISPYYWVFVSGLTNQGYTVTVRDTVTKAVKTYTNPRGQVAKTIADTAALPCN
jgi:hypothetical protein